MSNKNVYDEALAKAIESCLSLEEGNILEDSYIHSDFPGGAMLLVSTEQAIIAKIGIPEGWSEPLTKHKELFKLWVMAYLRNTPSINERRSKGKREMIAEASKRPPMFNQGVSFDNPISANLQTKREAK